MYHAKGINKVLINEGSRLSTCISLSVVLKLSIKRGVFHKSSQLPTHPRLTVTSPTPCLTLLLINRDDALYRPIVLYNNTMKYNDIVYAFTMNTYTSLSAGLDDKPVCTNYSINPPHIFPITISRSPLLLVPPQHPHHAANG